MQLAEAGVDQVDSDLAAAAGEALEAAYLVVDDRFGTYWGESGQGSATACGVCTDHALVLPAVARAAGLAVARAARQVEVRVALQVEAPAAGRVEAREVPSVSRVALPGRPTEAGAPVN